MAVQEKISSSKLRGKIGKTLRVIVDAPGVGRGEGDAPEIDGVVRFAGGTPGEWAQVRIERADEHDLFGSYEAGSAQRR